MSEIKTYLLPVKPQLLDVRQHIVTNCLKGPKRVSFKIEKIQEFTWETLGRGRDTD